jgi:hypothetical protein
VNGESHRIRSFRDDRGGHYTAWPLLSERNPAKRRYDCVPGPCACSRNPPLEGDRRSMSPQRSLTFQGVMFLILSARRSSQEGQLSRDLLCVAEDERQRCLDRPMVTAFGVCMTGSDYKKYYHFILWSRSSRHSPAVAVEGVYCPRPRSGHRIETCTSKPHLVSSRITKILSCGGHPA